MTAHRSKGLEWRLVVVAGVQEGLWPDLRRRGSLLEADRIGRDGLAEPLTPGALLAEERRLFYVAATRARERLVVTAVKAPGGRRRPALPLPDRTRRRTQGRHRPPPPPPVGRRARRRTPRHHRRPARLGHPQGGRRPPAGPARRARRRGRPPAGPVGPPLPLVGHVRADRVQGAAAQPRPARRALRQRPRPARQHLRPAVVPGPRGEGRRARDRRPGLRQRGARPRRRGRLRAHPRRPRRPHGAPRLRVERARLRRAVEVGAGEGERARGARTLPEVARRWTAPGAHRWPASTTSTSPSKRATSRCASAARWTVSRPTARAAPTSSTSRPASRRPAPAEVARHPQLAVYQLAVREGAVDEAFDGVRPEPGGAELVQLRQGAAKRDGGETPAQGAGAGAAGRGVGRRSARHGGRQGPRRTVHAERGPALHPLRVPGVVQRAAGGTARRGVRRARRCDRSHHACRPALLPARGRSVLGCQWPPLASPTWPPVSPIPSSSRSSSASRSPRSRRPASPRRPPRR